MSLLMDALKKAEEAKRQSEAAVQASAREPAQATPVTVSSEPQGLPELPSRLELLDHEFHPAQTEKQEPTTTPAPLPRQPAEQARQRERAAAQNIFQAKQPPQRRSVLIVGGMITLIAAASISGWVWWQMQPKSGLASSPATARSPTPAPVTAAPITPASPPAIQPAVSPSAAAQPTSTPVAAPPKAEAPHTAAAPEGVTFSKPAPKPPAAAQPAAPEPENPIRITKGRLQVNPQVASAYQAFQSGDLAAAQRDYQAVLRSEPKNTDALHGLAAISLRQGQPEAAEDYYFRILESDPKDNAAHAGLIGLRGQVDPMQSESRLKNLLAGQPESPTLHFALGNLYARQGRWNDAQQAYFRAYTADSENPDYQFNLAVSLDQLRQPKLALQYYQGALAAAAQRPAAFDRNQVAGRVSELQK